MTDAKLSKLTAILVSRKFNPGHYSHLFANYKLFSEAGISSYIYCHKSFNKMNVVDSERVFNKWTHLKVLPAIDVAVFWFPSIKNIFEILLLRARYKTHIIYVLHEPFESVRSYYESGFGVLKTFKIILMSLINYLLILFSDKVLLPSLKAHEVFVSKYSHTKKPFTCIPLFFDDEAQSINPFPKRTYISYIGTIAKDHAFSEYVKFVVYAIDRGWFSNYQFLIATRSILPKRERALLKPYLLSGRIFIKENAPMSTDEINGFYNTSVLVWNAYKRSMQSGVLPKCYMFGTPVIISNKNSSEYFQNYKQGIEISSAYDQDEIFNAVSNVINDFANYSSNCRDTFEKVFYYKAVSNKFIKFINSQCRVEG